MQSAGWLAKEVAGALHGSHEGLDHGLARYTTAHRRRLAGDHRVMCNCATGRRMTPMEKLLFAAAAHDDTFTSRFERFTARDVAPGRFVPTALVRAAAVELRHRIGAR